MLQDIEPWISVFVGRIPNGILLSNDIPIDAGTAAGLITTMATGGGAVYIFRLLRATIEERRSFENDLKAEIARKDVVIERLEEQVRASRERESTHWDQKRRDAGG